MNKLEYKRIKEDLYETSLENGLRIFYMQKKGFEKSFAMLSTNFGSVHSVFTTDGKKVVLPDGVAHFLEHKVFEQKEGNALQMFSKTGASPNAFTSHNMTAYYFGCTSSFEENLKILLKFVYNPYFTEENVAKEQGIIGQEIAMINDNPNWQAYNRLYSAMYESHPVRNSIAGSVSSIAKIDKDLLYTCHKTFYDPKNMVLCIAGDVDIENVINLAKEITPKSQKSKVESICSESKKTVLEKETTLEMQVSMPIFMIGFKDIFYKNDYEYEIIATLACKYLAGTSSNLYSNLYNKGLISGSLESEYTLFDGGGAVLMGGESKNPYVVRDEILKAVKNVCENGVEKTLFESVKKSMYGGNVRMLDLPEELCVLQTTAYFLGRNYYDFAEIYDKITEKDVLEFWKRLSDENLCSLSIIKPKEKVKE